MPECFEELSGHVSGQRPGWHAHSSVVTAIREGDHNGP